MSKPKILGFAGSTRKESFNKTLVSLAAKFARESDAEVTIFDLQNYSMPFYDGDLEQSSGIPESANELYKLFVAHDGFLIASPEYNSSVTAVLKNMIDWISRPRKDELPMAAFAGKTAGLMSASPGQLGGLRGLVHLRSILGNIGVLVIPDQVAINNAHQAFSEDGSLLDEKSQSRLEKMVHSLVRTTANQISS